MANTSAGSPPSPEKIFPVSWDQFHRDSRALAWRLHAAGPFEAVVCITRGGLVPAAIVARELNVRMIETVCVASYQNYKNEGEIEVLKGVAPEIVDARRKGKRVLIVDDLVDTGKTARVVRESAAGGAFRHRLCQAAGPAAGRHLRHRGVAGHLDLFPLGYRPRLPAADPRGRGLSGRGRARMMPATNIE